MNKKIIQSVIKNSLTLGVLSLFQMFIWNNTVYAAPYDIPVFELTWGTNGTASGQFNQPVGIAVAENDTVYVADTNNNRVQIFDSVGTFISSFGSSGTANGQFINPQGLAIDYANEWVYVVDNGNSRVQKFDLAGNFILSFTETTTAPGNGSWFNPYGIVVDQASGNVFVSLPGEARVDVHNSNGSYLFSTIQNGNTLNAPRGMVIVKDQLFVADQNGNDIVLFNKNTGTYISEFGSFGTGKGQFSGPRGMTLDYEGYLYVADRNNSRVQKFASDGTYLGQWGKSGTQNGQFNGVYTIAGSPTGLSLYTTETSSHRVQKFSFQQKNK